MFVDIGNVWDTEFDINQFDGLTNAGDLNGNGIVDENERFDQIGDYGDWKQYRSSVGISVQWLSPMGPMVFSFSKALEEREGDDARFFTFNIGQTF
jgi:outer membrane protein insertion porin family